jgi:hypothetical protein
MPPWVISRPKRRSEGAEVAYHATDLIVEHSLFWLVEGVHRSARNPTNITKTYWDDLKVGNVLWGEAVTVNPDEMLEYAKRNDPQPFHLDEVAPEDTPFGGLIASGGYTVTLWYRSAIPILTKLAFLGGAEWTIKLGNGSPQRPTSREN